MLTKQVVVLSDGQLDALAAIGKKQARTPTSTAHFGDRLFPKRNAIHKSLLVAHSLRRRRIRNPSNKVFSKAANHVAGIEQPPGSFAQDNKQNEFAHANWDTGTRWKWKESALQNGCAVAQWQIQMSRARLHHDALEAGSRRVPADGEVCRGAVDRFSCD
jgi:hypothetical protein